MAIVKKGSSILGTEASTQAGKVFVHTTQQRNAVLTRYWGDITKEKRFPIALWKLKQLFKASETDEVALRVSDVNDREYIDGKWLPFNSSIERDLDNSITDGICYFVLHESLFRGPISNTPNGEIGGMLEAAEFSFRAIVWGRIGLNEDGSYAVFFEVADCPVIDPGTVGGDGLTSGVRIPPGGQEHEDQ